MTDHRCDCGVVVRALYDFVDDELPAREAARIAQHLRDCDGCAGHVRVARLFVARLGDAPPDLRAIEVMRARIHAALRAEADRDLA